MKDFRMPEEKLQLKNIKKSFGNKLLKGQKNDIRNIKEIKDDVLHETKRYKI